MGYRAAKSQLLLSNELVAVKRRNPNGTLNSFHLFFLLSGPGLRSGGATEDVVNLSAAEFA